jgi:hypothetical protein
MAPAVIAAIIGLAGSAAKMIGGGIQASRAKKRQNELWANRPQLGMTEGERQNNALYEKMANATQLPGYNNIMGNLDQSVASGIYDAQKSSISSLGATQAAVDLNSKKMDALRDLAGMFAEYKTGRMDALGRWNSMRADYETQRFDVNQFQPWGMQMNESVAGKKAGVTALGQGLDSGLSLIQNNAGSLFGKSSASAGQSTGYGFGPPMQSNSTPFSFQAGNMPTQWTTPYQQRMSELKKLGYTEG